MDGRKSPQDGWFVVFAVVSAISAFTVAENLPALTQWADRLMSLPTAWAGGVEAEEDRPPAAEEPPCPACGAAEKVGVKPRD